MVPLSNEPCCSGEVVVSWASAAEKIRIKAKNTWYLNDLILLVLVIDLVVLYLFLTRRHHFYCAIKQNIRKTSLPATSFFSSVKSDAMDKFHYKYKVISNLLTILFPAGKEVVAAHHLKIPKKYICGIGYAGYN